MEWTGISSSSDFQFVVLENCDTFKLWCRRRLLRVPWTARRWNQSVIEKIKPEYSLKGLMLRLKLQHSGHLMQRADSLEKTMMLSKVEGQRRRWWRRMRWLESITNSVDMSLSKLWEVAKDRGAWGAAVLGVTKNWRWQRLNSNTECNL